MMSDYDDDLPDTEQTADPIPPNESTGAWQAMVTEHVLDYERAARTGLMLMVSALHFRDRLRCSLSDAIEQVATMTPADLVIATHDMIDTLLDETRSKRGRR
jgi:hypothetical protein